MGAYLSAPVTEKRSSDGASESFAYGTTAMQGWRTNMEVRARSRARGSESARWVASMASREGRANRGRRRERTRMIHSFVSFEI